MRGRRLARSVRPARCRHCDPKRRHLLWGLIRAQGRNRLIGSVRASPFVDCGSSAPNMHLVSPQLPLLPLPLPSRLPGTHAAGLEISSVAAAPRSTNNHTRVNTILRFYVWTYMWHFLSIFLHVTFPRAITVGFVDSSGRHAGYAAVVCTCFSRIQRHQRRLRVGLRS